MVRLDDLLLGDLRNTNVDSRLLSAILLREGRVAQWLSALGVTHEQVKGAFPDSAWE